VKVRLKKVLFLVGFRSVAIFLLTWRLWILWKNFLKR